MTTRIPPRAPPSSVVRPGGGGGIRPMYGIFIRDQVAKFRTEIGVTVADTKKAIAAGNPKGPQIFGDGILQGTELTKAKAAVKDLEKAVKALKPVFGDLGAPKFLSDSAARANLGRPGGGMIAMYGVVMRDDLSKFRSEIGANIRDIRAAINSGELKGPAKLEAGKAIKHLEAALKDLGKVSWT